VQNKLIEVDAKADLELEKQDTEFFYNPRLDARLTLLSFQGLRQFLEARHLLIPAPLHVLDGQVVLKANGPVTPWNQGSTFPVDVEVHLASANQKVNLTAHSDVRVTADFHQVELPVKLKVQDMQLELPPLDPIQKMPAFIPDSRIQKAPRLAKTQILTSPAKGGGKSAAAKPAFKLILSFDAETASPGAIRLMSQFANPDVPITAHVSTDPNFKPGGFVQLEPFKLQYLRRELFVQKMRVDLNEVDQGVIPVDGQLKVKQTNYTVLIDIKGTVKSPQVTMTSVPELGYSDIISVLLFDRTNDELQSADADTTGSFQAALADRAIGLVGLWAFASTPIKSFSYNPLTKQYSATLELAHGLTAGVGTNWEQSTSFELRKRVSREWVLTASWVPDADTGQTKQQLVLQWEKRF
jgi:hypothetical protein